MIVLHERDLEICCDSGECDKPARYVIILKLRIRTTRLYCSRHTAELLQRAAQVLRDDEDLHQYIDTEHLMRGASINV